MEWIDVVLIAIFALSSAGGWVVLHYTFAEEARPHARRRLQVGSR